MQNPSMTSKVIAFLMIFPAVSGCVEDSVVDSLELEFSVDTLVGGDGSREVWMLEFRAN